MTTPIEDAPEPMPDEPNTNPETPDALRLSERPTAEAEPEPEPEPEAPAGAGTTAETAPVEEPLEAEPSEPDVSLEEFMTVHVDPDPELEPELEPAPEPEPEPEPEPVYVLECGANRHQPKCVDHPPTCPGCGGPARVKRKE